MSWESFSDMTDTRSASYGIGALVGAGWRAIDVADTYLFEAERYDEQWTKDVGYGGILGLVSYVGERGLAEDMNYSDDIWLGAGFASGAAAVDGLIYGIQSTYDSIDSVYDDIVEEQ